MASLYESIMLQRAISINLWFPEIPTYDQVKWDTDDMATWNSCSIERGRNLAKIQASLGAHYQVCLWCFGILWREIIPTNRQFITSSVKRVLKSIAKITSWTIRRRPPLVIFPKSWKTQHKHQYKAWSRIHLWWPSRNQRIAECWEWKRFCRSLLSLIEADSYGRGFKSDSHCCTFH